MYELNDEQLESVVGGSGNHHSIVNSNVGVGNGNTNRSNNSAFSNNAVFSNNAFASNNALNNDNVTVSRAFAVNDNVASQNGNSKSLVVFV
jgi:hypothetical protein